MRVFFRLLILLVLVAGVSAGCRKEANAKADSTAVASQDTMLLRDLAEANRNTAAASAVDNSLSTVRTTGDSASLTGLQNTPTDRVRPVMPGTDPALSGPRLTPPLRANDAPAPTTVPVSRSPTSGVSARSSRDPCDSPSMADQRYCLNRSIVANDADLNRTYQEVVDQARKSGGSDLEERFRQSQREWINQRDSDCTAQTQSEDGKLWARARARCLANYSSKRAAELHRNLNSLRGQ